MKARLKTWHRFARLLRQGFSLTEVVCALGLVAGTALPVAGVLSMGLNDARVSSNHRTISALRGSVRQMLADPAWPRGADTARWESACLFDVTGRVLEAEQKGNAVIEARMTSAPGAGFISSRLESVRVSFHALPSGEELGRCVVQRARQGG
jgi:uncharacterized protein (TIGR02598 family)